MKVNIPRTEGELLTFIKTTGLIGLSLTVLYLLFGVLIFDKITICEPNRMILYTEIGLVSGFLGSAFAKPKKGQDDK